MLVDQIGRLDVPVSTPATLAAGAGEAEKDTVTVLRAIEMAERGDLAGARDYILDHRAGLREDKQEWAEALMGVGARTPGGSRFPELAVMVLEC